jgi:hypothetical protein
LDSSLGKSDEIYSISMKKIQSDSTSGSEAAIELDILPNKMKSRGDINFLTTKLMSLSLDVEDVYSAEKWNNSVLLLEMFHWTPLKNPT